MPDLVEEIFTPNRVHLIGGVPDAGKTAWLMPAMVAWQRGESILGRVSHPVPWVYIAGDRTEQEAREKITQLQLNPADIPLIPAFGSHLKSDIQVLSLLTKLTPKPELIVWEGFQDLCGETKAQVREFLCRMCAHCESQKFTILGVVESPKQKPQETYRNPRQRISGVSSWAYHSSTVIIIEGVKGDEALETAKRTFWVCVKGGKRRKLEAEFDDRGRLLVLP